MKHHETPSGERSIEKIETRMAELRERYPDANLREDTQYFIYDLVDNEGHHITEHVHKMEKLPIQVDNDHIVKVSIWDVIEADLKHRHESGRTDYSIVAALRKEGIL